MRHLLLKCLRGTIIKRLWKAGYGNQFIGNVLEALGLKTIGVSVLQNPTEKPNKMIGQPKMCRNCGKPPCNHIGQGGLCPKN